MDRNGNKVALVNQHVLMYVLFCFHPWNSSIKHNHECTLLELRLKHSKCWLPPPLCHVPFPLWKIAFENENQTPDCISAQSQWIKFSSHLMASCHVPDKFYKKNILSTLLINSKNRPFLTPQTLLSPMRITKSPAEWIIDRPKLSRIIWAL